MEIKAELIQPYTEEEKTDFIINQNHNLGYEIRYVITSSENKNGQYDLQAWGQDEQEIFEELKQEKYDENQKKLDYARVNHIFTVTLQEQECTFDTKEKTQSDLNSAMLSANAGYPWKWTTNNKVKIYLQVEDIITINETFQTLVNEDIDKWTYFEELIDNAKTKQELDEIDINYDIKINLGDMENDITN